MYFLIYKLLSSNYISKKVFQDMDYNVIAFENSEAIGMCISGKIQYIYIYRQGNKTIVLTINAIPSTLTINHQGISIIQEMACCEKILIIHSVIHISMNTWKKNRHQFRWVSFPTTK